MSVLSRQSTAAGPPLPPVSNASHGSQILAITGSFTALATLAVIARVYVRAVMLKTMGADDYVMILATVCSIFVFISFVVQVHLGIGEHIGNPHIMSNFITIMHWSYFHAWVLVIGISSVKISVGLFLLRLVQTRWYKRFIMSWICFLIAFTLACVGTLVFQCSPISAAWDFTQRANAKCYSTKVYRDIGLFNGAVNIFTDFIFATLPLPIVMPLQMNIRTKLSVIGVLSLGYFACTAAIVREVLLSTFFTDPDYSFNDSYQVWNDIEITAGILAACLPALRPFFAFLLDSAASITHRSGGAPGSAVPRHRYYMQKEEEDISMKLGPIRSHGTGNSSNKLTKSGYGVTVIGGASTSSHDRERERDRDLERGSGWGVPKASDGPRGILEQSLERDDGSEEGILSPVERVQTDLNGLRKDGIVRTREIHIS